MIDYYLMTKPGILIGNLIAMFAGFFLASQGTFYFWTFFSVLLGLSAIIASACVFNNYIDRDTDKKMNRTKTRALAKGTIPISYALIFGMILFGFGNLILIFYTNLLTTILADVGFVIYVFFYSLWKSQTIYGTAIGSLAGAIPPVVGYCAVSNSLDGGALLLFLVLVMWQMPHFYAIAMMHLKDYKAAGLPLLPLEKGILQTKIHMTCYIIAFLMLLPLLTFFNFTGYIYLIASLTVSLLWFGLCLKGFRIQNEQRWAKDMFFLSLIVIMTFCSTIIFDKILI